MKITHEQYTKRIKELYGDKYTILSEYTGGKNPIKVRNNICGHEYTTSAYKITNGNNCAVCYGGTQLTHNQFAAKVDIRNPHIKIVGRYQNARTPIECVCLKCGGTIYPLPDAIMNKDYVACNICKGKVVQIGINDMWTTAPELAMLLYNENDGYKYTKASNQKVDWVCPICNTIIKNRQINNVYFQGLSCSFCGHGTSYPEKFMSSILEQLQLTYEHDYSFEWSKKVIHENDKLSGTKRYDFYVNNIIIETHGNHHYSNNGFSYQGGRTLEEEILNDQFKKELALQNGIEHYVILDCRKSEIGWIKNSIMNSELPMLLNFTEKDIDWTLCDKLTNQSEMQVINELWNEGLNTKEIAQKIHRSTTTVISYLNKGASIGLSDFSNSTSHIRYNQRKAN